MKKLVFALSMFVGGVMVVNAQDTTSTTSPADPTSQSPTSSQAPTSTMGMQEDGRVKIKSQDLPEEVKSSLESQEYRGWLVSGAYKMDGASTNATGNTDGSTNATNSDTTSVSGSASTTGAYAQEIYIVELKNGAQTKTVRFDKDGKKLDDAGMNDDQK
ncbi:hypothetical protein [Chryseosolibacter indicus]|uniref:Beta-lactamase-inhibitor-like PepSY-like domain-containing protein n=1 Tax=Chryseosolibacter indicus TaxID=2782351 RepID=A0ABS5VM42_9BACT|nr:hypothetical protein [Chryseosolibacter indicus]MBT1702512.1 hypothetical protein [Chryseosolibacter indicus]